MKRAQCIGAVTLAFSIVLPATAADEKPRQSSCAFVRSIDGWKAIDDRTAIIETSPKRKFKVTFTTPCRELKWAHFARIDPRPSSAVCLSPGDVLVFGRGAAPGGGLGNEERCMIQTIEPVEPAPKPD